MASSPLFVARPTDLDRLRSHFDAVRDETSRCVLMDAPLGGGKRALIGSFTQDLNALEQDVLIWRNNLLDEEDGLRTLLRLYAGLFTALQKDQLLKSRVEMVLNAQLPQQPKRIQGWYQGFVETLKSAPNQQASESIQVRLPRDNPLLGLVELTAGISAKMPVVLEIQNLHLCQSLAVHAFVEALMERCKNRQLLLILGTEEFSAQNKTYFPSPWMDLIERKGEAMDQWSLDPWGVEEVAQYLQSKEITSSPEDIARISQGRPGYVAELVDHLEQTNQLEANLSEENLSTLFPREFDHDEFDPNSYPDTKRKVADPNNLGEVVFRAALLGRAFPSGLLADIGGYDRDSIDDLLDAAAPLFKELQFSKPLQTWLYQFPRAIWHQGALDSYLADPNRVEEGKEMGRRTAFFLERFLVPQSYDFIVRTARLYAQMGDVNRARMLRSMALGGDRPEVWSMAHDLIGNIEVEWPDAMARTIFMNLLDRMVQNGNVQRAEPLYDEAMAWADDKDDRQMKAWLLFAGSRLDYRRQDYYRARDRAQDSRTLYKAVDDPKKIAEIENHLGLICLSDGQADKALEHVEEALKLGRIETPEGERVLPQVAAQSAFIRGLVAKQAKDYPKAAEHFQKANEIAGSTGQAAVALESGLGYGESLLLAEQPSKAVEVLGRVQVIAKALRNPVRERAASALLGQAQGGLKRYDEALETAVNTLRLTRELKLEQLEPIDLYNVGFFQLMLGQDDQALESFRQSRSNANLQQDVHFAKELLFNTGIAASRSGQSEAAQEAFHAALPAARHSEDHAKLAATCQQLADIYVDKGESERARELLTEGIQAADKASLKEQKENMTQRLESL
ncbi:MAG: hypothetical protein VX519_01945 [Myxococcota bacterium]|nr:hypothetical protein [Myxococcota bacterium]